MTVRTYRYRSLEVGMTMKVAVHKIKAEVTNTKIDYATVGKDEAYEHYSKWFDAVWVDLIKEGKYLKIPSGR